MKQNIVISKYRLFAIDCRLHFQNIVKCTLVLCSFLKSIVGLTAHNRVNVLTTLPSFEVFIIQPQGIKLSLYLPVYKQKKARVSYEKYWPCYELQYMYSRRVDVVRDSNYNVFDGF